MDSTIVVSITSAVVAIVVAVVSAVASDRASKRSAKSSDLSSERAAAATEAAAARIERAERDTRHAAALPDLRDRRAAAYRRLIEQCYRWDETHGRGSEDEQKQARRDALEAFADAYMWVGPGFAPRLRVIQAALFLGPHSVNWTDADTEVDGAPIDALFELAHSDLMATYPTT